MRPLGDLSILLTTRRVRDSVGRAARACLAVALVLVAPSCAARLTLPQGAGVPMSDATSAHADVARACRGVRTYTAELGLAGQVGTSRLRGRVLAGFDAAGAMRLEGLAPFGPPAFVLVARPGAVLLLLPRDQRVLRHTDAGAVLEALSGVPLLPDDLLAVLTGCVVPGGRVAAPAAGASAGRIHDGGWASIDLEGNAAVFLRRAAGAWALRAARRPSWDIGYDLVQSGLPRALRLQSTGAGRPVTLTVTISQLEANTELSAAAFELAVPPGTESLSLDELRAAGPLRERP